MFIQNKKMPNRRTTVQIVKSVRTGTKVRQRVRTARDDHERYIFGPRTVLMTDLQKETNGQHILFNLDEYTDLVDRSRYAQDYPVPDLSTFHT